MIGQSHRGKYDDQDMLTHMFYRRSSRRRSTGPIIAADQAIPRDLVNATVGFEELAAELHKPSKSLHRMLAPRGNPSTENFFSTVNTLQKKARVKLRVTAKAG